MKMGKVQERGRVVQFTVVVAVRVKGFLKGTRGGKLISTEPRFRSAKSVAGTKFVKYLTKCRRFLRGSLRY